MTKRETPKDARLQWWKIQTPVFAHSGEPQILLYNQSGDITQELVGELADKLIRHLGMEYGSDKRFIRGLISDGQFMVDKGSLTREEKF